MFSRDNWERNIRDHSKEQAPYFFVRVYRGARHSLSLLFFSASAMASSTPLKTFLEMTRRMSSIYFRVERRFRTKGTNRIDRLNSENSDLADIKKNFPLFLEYVTPRISRQDTVKYRNESNVYNTRAVAPSHQAAEKTIIMKGRFLNQKDIEQKSKHAIIGRLVEQDLFGSKNSIGKYVDIAGSAFKVIGVFQDEGGDNEERRIYVPYTTKQLIEKNTDKVDQLVVAFKPEIGYAGAMAFEKSLDNFIRGKKIHKPEGSKRHIHQEHRRSTKAEPTVRPGLADYCGFRGLRHHHSRYHRY